MKQSYKICNIISENSDVDLYLHVDDCKNNKYKSQLLFSNVKENDIKYISNFFHIPENNINKVFQNEINTPALFNWKMLNKMEKKILFKNICIPFIIRESIDHTDLN